MRLKMQARKKVPKSETLTVFATDDSVIRKRYVASKLCIYVLAAQGLLFSVETNRRITKNDQNLALLFRIPRPIVTWVAQNTGRPAAKY